jgi:DNA-binding MarR family transcriptional regulator
MVAVATKFDSMNTPSTHSDASDRDRADENFGLLVHYIKLGLTRHLERDLAESHLGVNFTQYRVLMRLNLMGVMTSSELAREIEHDAGALTRVLDRMVEQGYVLRTPNEHDRRSTELSLTESGKALVVTMRKIGDTLVSSALSDLSPEEQLLLRSLLKRVRATLDSPSFSTQGSL